MKKIWTLFSLVFSLFLAFFLLPTNTTLADNHSNNSVYAGIWATTSEETIIDAVKFNHIAKEYDTSSGSFWLNIQTAAGVVATSVIYSFADLDFDATAPATSSDHIFQFVDDFTMQAGTNYYFKIDRDANSVVLDAKTTYDNYLDYPSQIRTSCSGSQPDFNALACTWTDWSQAQLGSYEVLNNDGKLVWFFPKDGEIYNNSEWNDWGLYYDLDASDLGTFNLLLVHYTDAYGISYTDYDSITLTEDMTYWTLERTHDLPDGEVMSQGKIVKLSGAGCDTIADEDCTWNDIAETEIITWTASSTSGYTIFDNPWTIATFTPATTSPEGEEYSGFMGTLWGNIKKMFPLSLIYQFRSILNEAQVSNATSSVTVQLADILPAQAKTLVSGATILSTNVIDQGGYYSGYVLPAMNLVVHIFFFLVTLFMVLQINKRL